MDDHDGTLDRGRWPHALHRYRSRTAGTFTVPGKWSTLIVT
ncbi:hypothetical protein [Sphingomonas oligophenolica]|nr:hypothetical protein [Sphingomonas oligophenolica]